MEVDMLSEAPETDNTPEYQSTLQRLDITIYADIISDAEARSIAVSIQEYLEPELIEWEFHRV